VPLGEWLREQEDADRSVPGEPVGRPIAGGLHITGIVVVALAGDRIRELTRFESALALYFPLPRTLD